jgi:hypothetical protein
MKQIAVILLLVLMACDSPVNENGSENTNSIDNGVVYRYEYEFKNDRDKEVVLHYSRDYVVLRDTKDSKGKGYYLDSTLSVFDSVVVPVDSIVSIGSDNDTLICSPAYLLYKVPSRMRAVEYGHGMRWLSNDIY